MTMAAYDFVVYYSDGSIYQGRIFARSLAAANQTVLAELPAYPGDPEPLRLDIAMKLG